MANAPEPRPEARMRGLWPWARAIILDNGWAVGAIAIKLASAFLSFLLILLVARTGGAAVTGDYAMVVATANMAALLATFGLDQIMVRAIGGDLRQERPDQAWATLRTVVGFVAPTALAAGLVLALVSPMAALVGATPRAMLIGAVSVPLFPMLRIAVMVLRASGAVLWSQLFDGLAHTLVILTLVGVAVGGAIRIDAALLASFYAVSIVLVTAAAWRLLLRRIRHWPRGGARLPALIRTGWPILVAAMVHVFTQWVVLAQVGAVLGTEPVGAFRVAFQVVMIIAVISTTIESLVSPQFAGDFRIGDRQGAWIRHRRATALMLVAAIGPILLCLFAPETVLGLFGPEFRAAATALVIMAAGQIVNVLTGPIGGIMVMSGHERLSLKLSLAGLAIALAASLAIPVYGLVGAAIASTGPTIFRNVAAYLTMQGRLQGRAATQR